MSEALKSHLGGRWVAGSGPGMPLIDPVLGTDLVRADATGLDLRRGFASSREQGGRALGALSYSERAALLAAVVKVLQTNRAECYEIATANCGTVNVDSALNIEGAIYALSTCAKIGGKLGDGRFLLEGEPAALSKDNSFQNRHVMVPTRGLALFVSAFNFPIWGLWEKAAPALLSGVPVIVKPATATAWLAQRTVRDVVAAGVLPAGTLSVICGSSAGLLDALDPFDVVSFTGSAETAAVVRSHPAVVQQSVRVDIEADSANSALLVPEAADNGEVLELLAKEVVREMTQKSGQKCTAIRRVLVPESVYAVAAEAVKARLAKVSVGNPRNDTVRMGSLVNRAQWQTVQAGIAHLRTQTEVLHDGSIHSLIDADSQVACCVSPVLLGTHSASGSDNADRTHDKEVFGPVATLVPYRDLDHALALTRRGQGSLVASLYGTDSRTLAPAALAVTTHHGRVHIVSPDVATSQTGHGNAMLLSLHGGPGRAGGGEELGGLRALTFYHRRSVVQSGPTTLSKLSETRA
jgi:3,4-dehydroadipyl-CoA semialdehyde dehydrogenase